MVDKRFKWRNKKYFGEKIYKCIIKIRYVKDLIYVIRLAKLRDLYEQTKIMRSKRFIDNNKIKLF